MTPAGRSGLLGDSKLKLVRDLTDMDVVERRNGRKAVDSPSSLVSAVLPTTKHEIKLFKLDMTPTLWTSKWGTWLTSINTIQTVNHCPVGLKFQQCGQMTDPQKSALCWSETYFRPSTPHNDRRMAGAQQIYDLGKSGAFRKYTPSSVGIKGRGGSRQYE